MRITRRAAPAGYVAVDKPLARLCFNKGTEVTLAGNNTNAYHIFNGWHFGCTITDTEGEDFDRICSDFLSYLDRSLGRYVVFYIRTADAHSVKA